MIYPLSLGLHSQTDIVAAINDLHARLTAIELRERIREPVVVPSRFYGHCRDCRHLNTCNLSQLPEGGCVNWEKP